MKKRNDYYVVKKKAVPEVLLKVVEAKHLLDSEKVMTVQEATERAGISRSSFYKYKDDIFPFHDHSRGSESGASCRDLCKRWRNLCAGYGRTGED